MALRAASGRSSRVVFADLVGFTARAERLDPEDVRGHPAPVPRARCETELERYGGTVEKFIGDAVMAVFGAPIAHEDDAERAVRAALAVRDVGRGSGRSRAARRRSPPARRSSTSTRARRQGRAWPPATSSTPPPGCRRRAGQRHHRRRDDLPGDGGPSSIGRPSRSWRRERRSRSRSGRPSSARRASAWTSQPGWRAAGRPERRARRARSTRSRARGRSASRSSSRWSACPGSARADSCWELFQLGRSGLELSRGGRAARCRTARAMAFWALGEMVKAQAGILETDSAEAPREAPAPRPRRPGRAGARRWVETPPAAARRARRRGGRWEAKSQAEAFAAWRRFLEALAEQRPARAGLRGSPLGGRRSARLRRLARRMGERACRSSSSARPDPSSSTRRPGWGGGKANALTISLSPLSDEETAAARPRAPRAGRAPGRAAADAPRTRRRKPALRRGVRADGQERGPRGAAAPGVRPGIIAARLDALPADEKELIQAAAVSARSSGRRARRRRRSRAGAVELALHALERKEFVRRERRSSVGGETRVRLPPCARPRRRVRPDPAAQRAERHRRAAEWIESLGRPNRGRPRCWPTTIWRPSSFSAPRASTRRDWWRPPGRATRGG